MRGALRASTQDHRKRWGPRSRPDGTPRAARRRCRSGRNGVRPLCSKTRSRRLGKARLENEHRKAELGHAEFEHPMLELEKLPRAVCGLSERNNPRARDDRAKRLEIPVALPRLNRRERNCRRPDPFENGVVLAHCGGLAAASSERISEL